MNTATKEEKKPVGGNVYQLIARAQATISKEGIAKDKSNVQQNYKFRGIDDVYNALSPILAECGLCILPTVLERDVVERTTKSGGALFYVTVKVRFDFVSSHDNSKHEVVMFGEAMDSGDKATNKALSAAYKYACMQTFAIPTEGDNDADGTTHSEVKAHASVFKNSALRNTFFNNVVSSFDKCETTDELKTIAELNKDKFGEMDKSGNEHDALAVEELRKRYHATLSKLSKAVAEAASMQASYPPDFLKVNGAN